MGMSGTLDPHGRVGWKIRKNQQNSYFIDILPVPDYDLNRVVVDAG
jgi:hypothetical protein